MEQIIEHILGVNFLDMESILPLHHTGAYFPLWNKYRPVLLYLMVASENTPQTYRLIEREFTVVNPREPGGYKFSLDAYKGKAENSIMKMPVAKDLLKMLATSKRACEMMDISRFSFVLDKNFILHVSRPLN